MPTVNNSSGRSPIVVNSPTFPQSKTLFLKSNLLHIRTNEGEFEVENQKRYSQLTHEEIKESPQEYGGAVKIIRQFRALGTTEWHPFEGIMLRHQEGFEFRRVARLLPKEEKKEPFVKALDDIQKIENLSVNNSAHSFTESAYKEFETGEVCPQCGCIAHPVNKGPYNHWHCYNRQCPNCDPVESSEPQENIFDLPKDVVFDLQRIALADDEVSAGFGAGVEYRLIARSILNKHRKPVSAPVESQEEMYNEVRQEYLKHRGRIWTKEEVMLKWIIENYKLITRNP